MKKVIWFLLSLVFCFSFQSCDISWMIDDAANNFSYDTYYYSPSTNNDINVIITYGTPYFYNSYIHYYYRGLYYYPYYFNDYWYFRPYSSSFQYGYEPRFVCPRRGDFRFNNFNNNYGYRRPSLNNPGLPNKEFVNNFRNNRVYQYGNNSRSNYGLNNNTMSPVFKQQNNSSFRIGSQQNNRSYNSRVTPNIPQTRGSVQSMPSRSYSAPSMPSSQSRSGGGGFSRSGGRR